MVPLEDRIQYLSRINESNKLTAFNNMLLTKVVIVPKNQDLNETEEIYFGIINAILINNKADFEKYYNKKSKSKPTKDSHVPFVNDDFLIFSFIVGAVKFNLDKSWLSSILSIRNRDAITITFENILNENYYSTSNLPEIVFMFLQFINHSLITNDLMNFTFKKVTENIQLFKSRSDFHILCSLRAYDSILLSKESPDKSELDMFKKFNARFIKRITYLSGVIQAVLFGVMIYFLLTLPKYSPDTIEIIEKHNYAFTIFGALGFSFLGNVIPVIRNKSRELIMRLFGYPIELAKKTLEKTKNS